MLQSAKEVADEIVERATARAKALEDAGRRGAGEARALAEADARALIEDAQTQRQRVVGEAQAAKERMLVEAEQARDAVLTELQYRREELEAEIADASGALRDILKVHDNLRRSIEEALIPLTADYGSGAPTPTSTLQAPTVVGAAAAGPDRDGTIQILVVDDDDPFRALFAAALLDHGVVRSAIRNVVVRACTQGGEVTAVPALVDVFARHGLRFGNHRPIPPSRDAVRNADLILAATRGGVARALELDPSASAFTFKALIRLGEASRRQAGDPLRPWVESASSGRALPPGGGPSARIPRGGTGDRTSRPATRGARHYEAAGRELAQLVNAVGRVLWPGVWVATNSGGSRNSARHQALEDASTASPISPMRSSTPPNSPSQIPKTRPLAATTPPAPITNGHTLAAGK